VVVLPPDELDEDTADDFRERLLAIEDNTDVVVDLRRLAFCGSAGIRVLLQADGHLAGRDCSLTLSCPPEIFDRVLAACGLEDRFTVRRPVSRRARRLGGADAARR
jgi:anti-anti-sigma factor